MKKRMLLLIAVSVVALSGCQTKPPTSWVPVPLPLEPTPSTKLTVVGTGKTAEEAREAAIQQMVHQVILPPSEPESAPTAEFVAHMIRGYNVTGATRDFLGTYYVTVELTINQLGINYQELYSQRELCRQEATALKQDIEAERKLRQVAEERERGARQDLEQDRAGYENRMLELQAQRKLDEQRVRELSEQRLKDEKAMHELQNEIDRLKKQLGGQGDGQAGDGGE